MLSDSYDLTLDGVPYKIADVDERYVLAGEPLRPPNAQVVQGQQSLFNLRPDTLRWRMDNWNGGEGQYSFNGDPANGSQYWIGSGIDGFVRYGVLSPGRAGTTSAPSDLTTNHHIVQVGTSLYAISIAAAGTNYLWNGSAWVSTADFNTASAKYAVAGDQQYLYYYDGAGALWRQVAGVAAVQIGSGLPSVTGAHLLALSLLRDLYFLTSLGSTAAVQGVWQGQRTVDAPAASVQVYSLAGAPLTSTLKQVYSMVAVGPNRLYIVLPGEDGATAVVHEVVPDDASATGYGYIRAVVPGLWPDAAWFHQGYLWLTGPPSSADYNVVTPTVDGRQLFYLDFGQGTYGTLSSVMRDGTYLQQAAAGGPTGSRSFMGKVTGLVSSAAPASRLYEVDQTTGGVQQSGVGAAAPSSIAHGTAYKVTKFGSDLWLTIKGAGWRFSGTTPPSTSHLITSWYGFGVNDTKALTSVSLQLRKNLPANWEIDILFQLGNELSDNLSDFTLLGTMLAADEDFVELIADPASLTDVNFHRVRFAVRFDWVGGGTPTTRPELTALEMNCKVVQNFRVRDLWLYVDDEHSGGGRTGSQQIANIRAAGDSGGVVALVDGYPSHQPGVTETTLVTVDQYRVYLEKPGEGIAWVRLLEAV